MLPQKFLKQDLSENMYGHPKTTDPVYHPCNSIPNSGRINEKFIFPTILKTFFETPYNWFTNCFQSAVRHLKIVVCL